MQSKSRIFIPLLFAFHALIIFTLLRAALLLVNWHDVPHAPLTIAHAFFTGLRMDVAVILVLSLPFVLYSSMVTDNFFQRKWHVRTMEILYVAALYVFIFLN